MTNTEAENRKVLDDYTDTTGAAGMLGKSRSTVSDMADRGLLTRYRIGAAVIYYVPQVRDVAAALERLRVRN